MRIRNKQVFLSTLILAIFIFANSFCEDEKKSKFILPDVLVKGEGDTIFIGYRYASFISFPKLLAVDMRIIAEVNKLKLSASDEFKYFPPDSEFKNIVIKPLNERESSNKIFEIDLAYGKYNDFLLKLINGQKLEKFYYFITGETNKIDGFTGNSAKSKSSFSIQMDYAFEKNLLVDINANYKYYSLENPYYNISSYYRFDKMISDASVFLNYSPFSGFNTGTKFYLISTKLIQNHYNDCLAGFLLNINFPLELLKRNLFWFSFGVQNDTIYNTISTFSLEDRFEESSLKINIGVRIDEKRVSPVVRMFLGSNENSSFYMKYEPCLNYPAFYDLYGNPYYTEVNKNLKPTLNWFSMTIGTNQIMSENIKFLFEILDKESEDYVMWTDIDSNRIFDPVNVDKVSMFGINAEIEFKIMKSFVQEINYSYQNLRDVKNINTHITYIPYHKANISWKYSVPYSTAKDGFWETLEFKLSLSFIGARYYDGNISDTLDPYYLLDFELSKQILKNVKVFAELNNLLNQNYQIWVNYPELSSRIKAGVKIFL